MADVVLTARQLACLKYETKYPKKTQINYITQQIRNGEIEHADKVLGEWRINCTREWPEAFPPTDDRVAVDDGAATRAVLGELLVSLGKTMLGDVEDGAA